MGNAFVVQNPDSSLSPYSGMTRKHYIECAKCILSRVFDHRILATIGVIPNGTNSI